MLTFAISETLNSDRSFDLLFQILAMNRGENQNVLTVKVGIPEVAYKQFLNFCMQKWLAPFCPQHYQYQLIIKSIEDSWERLGNMNISIFQLFITTSTYEYEMKNIGLGFAI